MADFIQEIISFLINKVPALRALADLFAAVVALVNAGNRFVGVYG